MKSLRPYIKSLKLSAVSMTILLLGALAAPGSAAYAATPKWEQVKAEDSDSKTVVKDTDIEIRTTRGSILIIAGRPVQIKVYTILGQLVSRENLPAGTSQLNVQAHGIYIIKSGDLTCKVAI